MVETAFRWPEARGEVLLTLVITLGLAGKTETVALTLVTTLGLLGEGYIALEILDSKSESS